LPLKLGLRCCKEQQGDRGGKHKPGFAYAAWLFLQIWTMAFKVAAAPSVLIKGLHCQSSHCNSSYPDSTSDNRQRGSRVRRRRLQGSHQSAKPETAPQLQELAKCDLAMREAFIAPETDAAPSAESNSGDRGGKHKPGFAYAARLFLRIWTMAFKVAAAPSVLIKGLHSQSSHCNSSYPD
jgi:hypothetical protein